MAGLRQSSIATKYVHADVFSDKDPTADAVSFAFTVPGTDPVTGDWKSAAWKTTWLNGRATARCLVGPTGGVITLTKATWAYWVRVTDSPETPIELVGTIEIF